MDPNEILICVAMAKSRQNNSIFNYKGKKDKEKCENNSIATAKCMKETTNFILSGLKWKAVIGLKVSLSNVMLELT